MVTLILSENEIVDFEQDSLLAHKYPECFNNIALSGNRFSLSGKNIGDLVRFSVQVVNLTTFDISYNLLKYSDMKCRFCGKVKVTSGLSLKSLSIVFNP
jgi:hypothetical protein